MQTAEALARLPEAEARTTASPLWREEAGTAAAAFFTGLLDASLPALEVRAGDYADLYRSLIAEENVRQGVAVHPRLFIWGPFEARLQQTDVMILGWLNDGTWPEAAEPGPWLNRPMRGAWGCPRPRRRSATPRTTSRRSSGPARLPHARAEDRRRADGALALADAAPGAARGARPGRRLRPTEPWLGWARARDVIGDAYASGARAAPAARLAPAQDERDARRDLARQSLCRLCPRILKLEKLPELGADPDAGLRGSIVHEIMSGFAERFPENCLPMRAPSSRDRRRGHGRYGEPARRRVLAPRFLRFAEWFAETEPGARRGVTRVAAEVEAGSSSPRPAGPFTLSARADRIDVGEGGMIITDYKTGRCPERQSHPPGLSPQLPLEAAIARGEAGFAGVEERRVAALRYIRASGGEPPGEERLVKAGDIAELADTRSRGSAGSSRRSTTGDALQGAAPRGLQLRLRRLRASGARRRMGVPARRRAHHDRARQISDLERTRRAQRGAADPRASAWVSANAGTGKTHVLTLRALRLMLAGTIPERILCLTYTKAAAAEMSKRVYETLAKWVTMAEPRSAELDELDRAADERRDRARAHALHHRDRDAGRPQGADHPFVLRAAAAALPARSRRGAGLHHPRRGDRAHAAARGDRRGARRRDARSRPRPRARARRRRSATRRTSVSTTCCARPCARADGSRRRRASSSARAPTSLPQWRGSIAARSACARTSARRDLTASWPASSATASCAPARCAERAAAPTISSSPTRSQRHCRHARRAPASPRSKPSSAPARASRARA